MSIPTNKPVDLLTPAQRENYTYLTSLQRRGIPLNAVQKAKLAAEQLALRGGIPSNRLIRRADGAPAGSAAAIANPELADGSAADNNAATRLQQEMARRGRSSLSIPLFGAGSSSGSGFQSGGVFIPYYPAQQPVPTPVAVAGGKGKNKKPNAENKK